MRRIVGDCFDRDLASQVRLSFTAPIDLMFIDVVHDYDTTRRCIDLYLPLAAPELVILDDIRINDAMRSLWHELSAAHGDNAVDVTGPSRRGAAEGMGLLICG